jgi:hypothetical protein
MRLTLARARHRRVRLDSIGIAALLLLALVLGGCGTPVSATVGVALVEPTGTPTALPPTATPTAVPTVPPTATLTSTPAPPPSITPTSARPPVTPTPDGGYVADWTLWGMGENDKHEYRRNYDEAKNEYHIALLTDDQEWSFYAPEGQKFQNFTLEVEAYRVDGPDSLGYGLVFRRQEPQSGKFSERYIFYVTPQGRFSFFQVSPDNTRKTLRQLDAPDRQGVIKVGSEPNHLKVICQGTTITLVINDIEVFKLTNAAVIQAGEIGVFATAPVGVKAMEIAFRDLRLTPLP